MRELFQTGIKEALQTGVVVSKFLFRKIKDYISGNGNVGEDLAQFAVGLKDIVVDTTGNTLKYFFRTVRSYDDILDWIALKKLDSSVCLLATRPIQRRVAWATEDGQAFFEQPIVSAVREGLAEALFGRVAYAAGCAGKSPSEIIREVALNDAKYGAKAATEIAKSLRKAAVTLNKAGIDLTSPHSYDVLADIASKQGTALIETFARNASKGFATEKGYYKLNIQSGALDTLLESVGKVPQNTLGYAEWVAKMGVKHSFAIKGIAGESQAITKVVDKYADKNPVLTKLSDRIDEPFENLDGVIVKGNVEGVDAVFDLNDGTKVFVESKVLTNATGAAEKDVYERLEKQFFKHLETKVLPMVKSGQGGKFTFGDLPAPMLDYHLAGSWFTAERKLEIVRRFGEMLKDPRLKAIAKAEPQFSFDSTNIIIGDLLPSIIN